MLGEYDIYKDIRARTNGEIYMGVVGPVRTGKSTFIKRFMDLLVLPNIENVHSKERTLDELPQSAAGKTIMTTEPKFIPQEAARVTLSEDVEFDVRMIDCVGYMVEGATGHLENDEERKVKTPWFNYDIPFTQAAEIGTKKVINDHSTIGIVVTADGSFGEIPRENYIEAEERTINELKKLSKPYVVILNSLRPYSDDTVLTATELEDKYNVPVLPVNCDQLKKEDVIKILESVLLEFPLSVVNFNVPKWIEMLDNDHWLKSSLIDSVKDIMDSVDAIRDLKKEDTLIVENEHITKVKLDKIDLSTGCANIDINFNDDYYYDILSDLMGTEIKGEYQFMSLIKKLGRVKEEYDKVSAALNEVKAKGYGIVTPMVDELSLQEPEIVKQGNKYGVKLKASAPTIHMIKCDIQTEVSPIVGTEKQSEELLNYLTSEFESDPTKIWDTNVFGKSLHDLVNDGLQNKIYRMPEDARDKLQETLQKIVNDANGGLICIII
ncbi:stage IV sporulation protein A [Vallitalea sp.]|jgi:stage IV sporulation protein A|uniref:stage IV sporulation protein A n=1 Tax=Vallitalea sp. TaxID=1882829 RepID=UPI0025D87186|nr:stage IV sporulation protein A [Vallitalea sp.]MCT4687416.1 stage IV sporulation protein A [Vallitalea sp.]